MSLISIAIPIEDLKGVINVAQVTAERLPSSRAASIVSVAVIFAIAGKCKRHDSRRRSPLLCDGRRRTSLVALKKAPPQMGDT